MDVAIAAAAISSAVAATSLYWQFFRKGAVQAARPTTCVVARIEPHGTCFLIPLSLRNTGARPLTIGRFAMRFYPREGPHLPDKSQLTLQWLLCADLSAASRSELGRPVTIPGGMTENIVVCFLHPEGSAPSDDAESGWDLRTRHGRVEVIAHTEEAPKGFKLCNFELALNEDDLDRISSGEPVPMYQRWFGSKEQWNVLVPLTRHRHINPRGVPGYPWFYAGPPT